ncbi:MAG: redoxin domain-containing protein [Acidobacteriota bacterium]
MIRRTAAMLVLMAAAVWAQATPSVEEQQSLMKALSDGATSPVDMIRALEAHLAQFPKSTQRAEVELTLARAAIDSRDVDRIAKYGEPLLKNLPDDVILLDRVSFALLAKDDKASADRAYQYARTLENILAKLEVEPGKDAIRKQDERDRALGRTLLYQSRARTITKEPEEAVRVAARAFAAYPTEEAARELAENLNRAGHADEAIERLADAFVIPDPHSTDAARVDDRILLGEWYKKRHGSEKGLGDIVLAAFDRTSRLMETRRKKLLSLDPNGAQQNPMEFTITSLEGKRFRLSSLKGNVIVMDFWATWCVPCRVQHPLYQTLKERFPRSSGVVFLEMNADEERQVVEPFLEEQKWNKDVYFEDGLVRLLSVQNIPATILFDKTGNLASRMDGFDPETFVEQMTSRIKTILAAK